MNLSKSKYTQGVTCEKKMWLSCYKSEEAEDLGNEAVFANGNKVGERARELFGTYVLIDYDAGYKKMIEETNEKLKDKPNVICEASFSYDGNFCSVDILKNDVDGVEIYEVKSSTSINNIYIDDVAYQTWILKKLGFNVKKSCIVYVNNQYIKNGEFDINEFFNIEDVTNELDLDSVEENVNELKKVINSDKEPNNDLSVSCHKPYDCPFFKYCTKGLPTPNVFDIGWGTRFNKKIEMYQRGNVSFKDVLANETLNEKATKQVVSYLENSSPKIDKEAIIKFVDDLRYPLYFLDFESYQSAIPLIDGTKPYQQICFQYSLHYYESETGKLIHKEFLSDDYEGNPMYGLCKQLCEDIPLDSCILVFNDVFEKTRLREMANLFPEFSDHLLNIHDHIVDLLPIFKNHYYIKEMEGSYSIKSVLPALYPDDPSLDYHNLEQVHKGDEASSAFLSLPDLSKSEQEELRDNMLKYCALDTFAMVKIYEVIKAMQVKDKVFSDVENIDELTEEEYEEHIYEFENKISITKPDTSIDGIKKRYPNINFDNLIEDTAKDLLTGDTLYECTDKIFGPEWDYSAIITQWCIPVEGNLRKKIFSLIDDKDIKRDISDKSAETEYFRNNYKAQKLYVTSMMGTYTKLKEYGLVNYVFNNYIKDHFVNFSISDFNNLIDYIGKVNDYRGNSAHSNATIYLNKATADDCKDYIVASKRILEILSNLKES